MRNLNGGGPPLTKQEQIMKNEKNTVSVLFMLFSILFCVCLIAANLFATKQINVFGISMVGALIIFPISYIVNDVVSEVWGFGRARQMIWVGFAMNFFFVFMGFLCDIIPPAPFYENNEGFHAVFGLAPRVAAASFLAFLVGSFLNAYVMSRMKVSSQGKHFSVRAIASTLVGEASDSLIFYPLALGGVIPVEGLLELMFWQVTLKTAYEIVILPLTIRVVKWVKAVEGEDVYDQHISYNVFKLA